MAIINNLPQHAGGGIELLWENPNTNTEYPNGYINIDFSKYKQLFIVYVVYAGGNNTFTQIADVATTQFQTAMCQDWASYPLKISARRLQMDYSHMQRIAMYEGYTFTTSGGTKDNKSMVPYKIYGIK